MRRWSPILLVLAAAVCAAIPFHADHLSALQSSTVAQGWAGTPPSPDEAPLERRAPATVKEGEMWIPPLPARTLDVYVIDVEGGEATLFVSPSGESLLVDVGWPGFDGRDADRILAAARQAGIKQIDYLVITHYHADHVGGMSQLAERLPIRHVIDHGSIVDEDERALFQSYSTMRGSEARREAKPGDAIPIAGLNVRVIAAGGSVLSTPITGQSARNALCDGFKPHGPEITSRAADPGDRRSVSLFLTFGRFRTVIMGDLTWNKEFDLMCPMNHLGAVDVYLVSHHGSDTSGSPVLVHALRPRAAIMNNGPRKGGAVQTFQILSASPGLEDLWQSHYSVPGGREHNRPDAFIANLDDGLAVTDAAPGAAPVHMGAAHWIKLSAVADGAFTITNSRTGFTKRYLPRSSRRVATVDLLFLDNWTEACPNPRRPCR